MFTWINKLGVKSDKGFTVQITGRFELEYQKGHKLLTIERESGYDMDKEKHLDIISTRNFETWDDGSLISEFEKKHIMKNVKEALEYQNIGVVYKDIPISKDFEGFTFGDPSTFHMVRRKIDKKDL